MYIYIYIYRQTHIHIHTAAGSEDIELRQSYNPPRDSQQQARDLQRTVVHEPHRRLAALVFEKASADHPEGQQQSPAHHHEAAVHVSAS